MGKLEKLKISTSGASFEVKINPTSFSLNKRIEYTDDQTQGSAIEVKKYRKHGPSTLSFDFILDATGIAYDKTETIDKTIDRFESTVYTYEGEKHQPNELVIVWGKFSFDCKLESLKYDYTLFSPSGEALRVKVSVSFTIFKKREDEQKEKGAKSPDLSRIITLKAGESIPLWCKEIYGDASYCVDVARHNSLQSFRNIKPGTAVMFPPLIRHA